MTQEVFTARTRVKMCGFTQAKDIQAAVAAGADALGFVFYPQSKRYVSVAQAAELAAAIPAFVQSVALFVNAAPALVQQVLLHMQPSLVQFHGEESPAYCQAFNHPYIRAFRVGAPHLDTAAKLLAECRRYPQAKAWLFDSYTAGYGGSGISFNMDLLAEICAQRQSHEPPIVLAGGIDQQNVHQRLAQIQPYAIDISSAIEKAPGIKCATKMQQFMQLIHG